jgi:hypothetical protein
MLERILNFLRLLFTIERRPVEIDELFKKIDLEEVAQQLNVDQRGEEEGKANVPGADALGLAAYEANIANYFVQEAQATAVRAQKKIISYRGRIQHQDVGTETVRLKDIHNSSRTEFQNLVTQSQRTLPRLRQDLLDARSRLTSFREKHRLDHPAREVEKRKQVGFLAMLIVLESLLNAYFFSLGSDLGLLGGWLEALFASLINNGLAFIIGWHLLRNIFHRNALRKVVGWGSLLLFIGLAPLVNLGIAHYREAVAIAADTAQVDALRALTQSLAQMTPGIQRLDSWVLWTAGMAFAALALIDGLFMDDLYPGYGKLDREAHKAEVEYEDVRDELLESMDDEASSAENRIDAIAMDLLEKQQDLQRLAGMSDTIEKSCAGYHRVLEQSCEALLKRYRGKNEAHRTTPVPPHFHRRYQFTRLLLDLPETVDQVQVQQKVAEIEALMHEAAGLKDSVKTMYADYRRDIDEVVSSLEAG